MKTTFKQKIFRLIQLWYCKLCLLHELNCLSHFQLCQSEVIRRIFKNYCLTDIDKETADLLFLFLKKKNLMDNLKNKFTTIDSSPNNIIYVLGCYLGLSNGYADKLHSKYSEGIKLIAFNSFRGELFLFERNVSSVCEFGKNQEIEASKKFLETFKNNEQVFDEFAKNNISLIISDKLELPFLNKVKFYLTDKNLVKHYVNYLSEERLHDYLITGFIDKNEYEYCIAKKVNPKRKIQMSVI